MDKKPNILFIMTDQLRGDSLGYAGHRDVKTPYLDTLAAKGVDFTRAYSACPSCIIVLDNRQPEAARLEKPAIRPATSRFSGPSGSSER